MWDTLHGAATFGPTRPFVVRLTPDGALDFSFHGDGHAQLGWDREAILSTGGHPTALARDAQGRCLLAGDSLTGEPLRVWRFLP